MSELKGMQLKKGRVAARKWLDKMLEKYGNTYHFPVKERMMLDKKIELYGSTYQWRRANAQEG